MMLIIQNQSEQLIFFEETLIFFIIPTFLHASLLYCDYLNKIELGHLFYSNGHRRSITDPPPWIHLSIKIDRYLRFSIKPIQFDFFRGSGFGKEIVLKNENQWINQKTD
jgi:hypothetical protein